MSKKPLVLVIVAVVVAATGFSVYAYVSKKPGNEKPPQQTTAETAKPTTQTQPETVQPVTDPVTVTYDNNGFSPKEITVAKGTTVNFDNQTEIPMWVASDVHPDHTNYPEFDAIRVNGQYPEPKNDFKFTFDKPGIWTYHNHTMPDHTGKITVK